jgi:hypothetical protein
MRSFFLIVYAITAVVTFLQHPADEAAVRSFILAAAFFVLYLCARAVQWLGRRVLRLMRPGS